METDLKIAIWKIANAAIDMKDDKISSIEFEELSYNALMQVKNLTMQGVSNNEVAACDHEWTTNKDSDIPFALKCIKCGMDG